jgi:hypothetical protein
MSQCRLRVVLQVNRCVFNTSTISFRGNHDPVKHPMGASRPVTCTLLLKLAHGTDHAQALDAILKCYRILLINSTLRLAPEACEGDYPADRDESREPYPKSPRYRLMSNYLANELARLKVDIPHDLQPELYPLKQ